MVLNLAYNKNKPYKTSACWSKKFLNFGFLEKGLGIVFLSNLCTIFQEKYLSCNFIAWLPLRLEILVNMCSAIFRWTGCDFMNFENNFIFLIRSLLYTTKKYRQKIKYLENIESIKSEVKSIFYHFQGAFSYQNCLRPESVLRYCMLPSKWENLSLYSTKLIHVWQKLPFALDCR